MKIKSSKVLKSLIAVILAVLMIVGTTATGFAANKNDLQSTGWSNYTIATSRNNWGSTIGTTSYTAWGGQDGTGRYGSFHVEYGDYFYLRKNGTDQRGPNGGSKDVSGTGEGVYAGQNSNSWHWTGNAATITVNMELRNDAGDHDNSPWTWIASVSEDVKHNFVQGMRIYFNCKDHNDWGAGTNSATAKFEGSSGSKNVTMYMCDTANADYWYADVPTTGSYHRVSFTFNHSDGKSFTSGTCQYNGNVYDNTFYPQAGVQLNCPTGITTGQSNNIISNTGYIYFDNTNTNWAENKIYFVSSRATYTGHDTYYAKALKMEHIDGTNIYKINPGNWGDAMSFSFAESSNSINNVGYDGISLLLNKCSKYTTMYSNYNLRENSLYYCYGSNNSSTTSLHVDYKSTDTTMTNYNKLNGKVELQAQYKYLDESDDDFKNITTSDYAKAVAKPFITDGKYLSDVFAASSLSNKIGYAGLAKENYLLKSSIITMSYIDLNNNFEFYDYWDENRSQKITSDEYEYTNSKMNGESNRVYVRFREKGYTVQLQSSEGGSVTGTELTVGGLTSKEISAIPSTNYQFAGWSIIEGNVKFEDAAQATTTITASGDSKIQANFIEVSDSAKITLYFKSSDSYRYLPTVSIDGTAYEMNKLSDEEELSTGLKLGDNDTHTQSYHWYKKEVFLPKNSSVQLKFTNSYDMAASTTIEVGESDATYCYGVDNLNKGTELIDLTSYYDKSDPSKMAILNFYKSATFMCSNGLDFTLLSSSPAYTNLSGCRRVMGDIDKNDQLSITDVTCLQQGLAKINDLDNISNALADFNLDELVSISDGTMMQLRLVGLA